MHADLVVERDGGQSAERENELNAWSTTRIGKCAAFTPELFDRWLQIFHDTVDGGWSGPFATSANKRATGMAWAMARRFLGKGVWRPAEQRA